MVLYGKMREWIGQTTARYYPEVVSEIASAPSVAAQYKHLLFTVVFLW